jgi:hypothetical protein
VVVNESLQLLFFAQIAGCVFNEFLMKKDDKPSNFCVAADLFDFECYRANYYNTPSPLCKSHDLITSTRLWADVAAFIIIIFQIILFNTTYADQVQAFIIKKEANASMYASDSMANTVCFSYTMYKRYFDCMWWNMLLWSIVVLHIPKSILLIYRISVFF